MWKNPRHTHCGRGRTAIVGLFVVREEEEKVLGIETLEGGIEIERSRGDELEFEVEPEEKK